MTGPVISLNSAFTLSGKLIQSQANNKKRLNTVRATPDSRGQAPMGLQMQAALEEMLLKIPLNRFCYDSGCLSLNKISIKKTPASFFFFFFAQTYAKHALIWKITTTQLQHAKSCQPHDSPSTSYSSARMS